MQHGVKLKKIMHFKPLPCKLLWKGQKKMRVKGRRTLAPKTFYLYAQPNVELAP
jgi:hypothetical protein